MLWPLPSVAKNASLPSADALLWDTGSFAQRRFPPDSLYTIAGGSAGSEVWADIFLFFVPQLSCVIQKISFFKSK